MLPAAGTTSIGRFSTVVKLDQMEGINFPTRGYSAYGGAYASTELLGADDEYNLWNGEVTAAVSIGRHTLEAHVAAGGPIGSSPIPAYDQQGLGGFLKLSGLSLDQLRSDRYAFGRLIYRTKLAEIPMFEGVYVGGSLEAAKLRPLIPVWEGKPVEGQDGGGPRYPEVFRQFPRGRQLRAWREHAVEDGAADARVELHLQRVARRGVEPDQERAD